MNVLHTSNAKKGPHDAYNAYRDFTDKETDAQIISATMKHFNMEKIDGKFLIGMITILGITHI